MNADILESISRGLLSLSNSIGIDALFFVSLAVEAAIVVFFLVKSLFSYEAKLNRALEKMNVWLFNTKTITENNIKELNAIFKTKMPKRMCYFWQQYILFREGTPSSYMSTENLVDKPLKTSSYSSNIKNLSIFTWFWALFSAVLILVAGPSFDTYLTGQSLAMAIIVAVFVVLIGVIFVAYLRARKNSILNSLYQNTQLFGRFMDNACVDLPTYIDYQILFTPAEIEKGQPVLREFLDYRARMEKEEFNRARDEGDKTEEYDFSAMGVDGSLVLERAMKESEKYLKNKEKILLQISQFESQLETRRKNFDNVQKEYQTKIQASKENIDRLRQMQEETTNRIESNYYRKQQTQEASKQEQLEQEFEQQRARYLLEKKEGEEEIAKLNQKLEDTKTSAERAMTSEYQSFFDKFCKSAEKVVAKVFEDKITALGDEHAKDTEYITQLEIKLKNKPPEGSTDAADVGTYDENGNYIYPNGTFYDPQGNFHDRDGNIWSQSGEMIAKAEEKKEEPQIVDFDDFDPLDFMTDVSQAGDVFAVAENAVKDVDQNIEVNNTRTNVQPDNGAQAEENAAGDENKTTSEKEGKDSGDDLGFEDVDWGQLTGSESESKQNADSESESVQKAEKPQEQKEASEEAEGGETEAEAEKVVTKPRKKAGRPRKIVTQSETPKKSVGRPKKEQSAASSTSEAKKRGRPKKESETSAKQAQKKQVGRPKKEVKEVAQEPKKKAGRPRKIVQQEQPKDEDATKRGRGRPKKAEIEEINKRLTEEENRLSKLRAALNRDIERAVNGIDSGNDKATQRESLISEISRLQAEAQKVINEHESEQKISEINSKLESLLEEVKKLY